MHEIEWPHFHIQRTSAEQSLTFDELTLPEMVVGTIKAILSTEQVSTLAEIQFNHLADLMTDSEDFTWPILRQFNGLVLQDVEMGRYSWFDGDSIQKKKLKHVSRAQAVRRATATQPRPRQLLDSQSRPTNINITCKAYNAGQCNDISPHSTPEGLARHSCAHCHKTIHRFFGHPEIQCRRKPDPKA